MGILNVTPDSFSDGGRYYRVQDAVARGIEMADEGADIIDVGGESTRPGATPVPYEEEIKRVIPVIQRLSQECPVRISVDTYKPEVAKAAVKAGASLINDVTASLAKQASELGVGWIAMHMRSNPKDMQVNPIYGNVLEEVGEYLFSKAEHAKELGVCEIWIDPGIGFGKRVEDNLDLLAGLTKLVESDYPVMVGTSRKSFLGVLGATDPTQPVSVEDRLPGSLASAMWALALGAKMVRVHDVKETVQAAGLLSLMTSEKELA